MSPTLFSESFLQILNYTSQVPIKKYMKYNIYIYIQSYYGVSTEVKRLELQLSETEARDEQKCCEAWNACFRFFGC